MLKNLSLRGGNGLFMKLMQTIWKKINNLPVTVKASYWFLICGVLQKGLTLITTPIFTRLMTTSEYGLFSVYISWNSILTIMVSFNLASGVYLRGLVKFEEDKNSFANSLYSLALIIFGFWVSAFFLFKKQFTSLLNLNSNYIIAMIIDIYVCAAFQFWSAEQRVKFKYKKLIAITLANSLIQTIVGIVVILNTNNHVSARIYTLVVVDILCFGIFCFMPFFRKCGNIKISYWLYALKFNIPLIPHYLSQVVLNQSDRIMIERYSSVDDAGRYSLAYSLASVMTIVNTAIINTLTPWLYKKIKEKEYVSIRKNSVIILIFVAALNLLLVALAPEAIIVLAPREYYSAVYIVPPVSASVFFIFLYSWFSAFEFYFEKTYLMTVASISGAILNIVLNYIFIPQYGYLAAGYTTLFCYLAYVIGHYIFMNLICKKEIPGIKIYNVGAIVAISMVFLLLCAFMMCLYRYYTVRYIIVLFMILIVIINYKKIYSVFDAIMKK
jgi:O-antigen/teichoic acid export membrane protein